MSTLAVLFFSFIFSLRCNAFTFSSTASTECQPFTISWTGGTSPFTILLLPALDTPRNISVPITTTGSFTLQLPFKSGQQFIVTMSDSTGFASGGISDVLTVGSSLGQSSCNTATPDIPFFFDLPNPLVQCEPFNITWDTAIMPVTITAVIPLGQFVHFSSGTTDHFFVWNQVNVQAGTTMLFFLTDSQGNFGGTSHILSVGNEDDGSSACLNSQSPHTTATAGSGPTQASSSAKSSIAPSQTSTVNTNGTSSGSADAHGSKPLGGAAIGGIAAGGVVALVAAGLAGYFFCFRNPSKNNKGNNNAIHQGYSYDHLKSTPYNGSSSLLPTPTSHFNASPQAGQYQQVLPFVPQSQPYPTQPYQSMQTQPPPLQQQYSPLQHFGTTPPPQPHYASTHPTVPSIPGLVSPVPPSVLLAQRREANDNPAPQFIPTPYLQSQPRLQASTKPRIQSPPATPRIVVHTDADDIVELPPRYRDRPAGGSEVGSSTAVSDSDATFKS